MAHLKNQVHDNQMNNSFNLSNRKYFHYED